MRRAICAFLLSIPAINLWGQTQTGNVVGTVQDQTDAAIPQAQVTLLNTDNNFKRIVETNASGQYSASLIPLGKYTITAEKPGFNRVSRSGIVLTVGATLTVDLQLAVGTVQQTVEVTAASPLLQAQTGETSYLVNSRQVVDLPLNGRTFSNLVLLSPGAYTGSSANVGTGVYALRGPTNFSVNGSEAQNNSYLIDGNYNRNLWLSTLIMSPVIDSIQEFRVLTSNYSAEYGSAAGANTIVVTKSGTKQLHGDVWEFLRNEKLDANDFFDNRAGLPRPAFKRNEFGGTMGGPIRQNKEFFFADYEGLRLVQPHSTTVTIPTVGQRNMILTGNFIGLGATIYDPLTLHVGANGKMVRDPFSGNQIPMNRLDPAALKVISMIPVPINDAATRNFAFTPRETERNDQADFRFDKNLGVQDRLTVKYGIEDTKDRRPGQLPENPDSNIPVGGFASIVGDQGVTIPLRTQSGLINYIKVLSTTTVNEAHFGIIRWAMSITPLDMPFKTADALGIPNININNYSGGMPAFHVSGFQIFGDNNTFPENSYTTTFQYNDTLTIVSGNHTFKIGGEYLRHRFDGFSAFPIRGSYTFNGQFTRQVGTSGSQTALADFALGVPSAVTRNFLVGTFGMRIWDMAGFGQDNWRVSNRLTLNLGVRYEIHAPPYEVHNRFANLDLQTGKMVVAGVNGAGRRLRNLDLDNWAPRLGFAYTLTSDRKTVWRGGFGVSYVQAGQGGGELYKNPPFFVSQQINTDQNGLPALRVSDGLPYPTSPALDSPDLSSGSPNAWDRNLQDTKSLQWSLGVQRQMTPNLLFDVTYVGNRAEELISNININQPFPGPGAVDPRRPFYTINPLLQNVTLRTNYGSSTYHALQVRSQQAYARGLTLTAAYTYSHFLGNYGNINGGGNGPPQNARCTACEKGPMPQDRRHTLVINHVWELPFGPGRPFVRQGPLAQVMGGWNLTGIWTLTAGDHVTPTLASAVSNAPGGDGDRPDRVCNGNLSGGQRSIDRFFNLGCFVPPPQYTFGNAARGILVGPSHFNLDMGVDRDIRLTERFHAQFRWELFNAFNHPNFGDPNASIGNAAAGQISSDNGPREMQIALKVVF